ncbi:MAG: glycine cleavage system protein R [Chromatiales bacterium]|jgi:glycine cleavage system transcriptional repressor
MTSHLVIAAVGDDRPGIVEKLSKVILENGCNVLDSRMSVLGDTFAVILLTSGNWNALAKLETALAQVGREQGLTLINKRAEPRDLKTSVLPYSVDVVSMDQPGIVHELAAFFSEREINIQDMATMAYNAAHTATPMFSVRMIIEVPAKQHIAALREEFLDVCDELNLDGVLEPVKA